MLRRFPPGHRRRPPTVPLPGHLAPLTNGTPNAIPEVSLPESKEFRPTPQDIYIARALLHSLKLPTELVLYILSLASYEAKLSAERHERAYYSASSGLRSGISTLYLTAPPLLHPDVAKGEDHKVRCVTFKLCSADQGWGGEAGCAGTYRGSYTWFEASILRPIRPDRHTEPLEKADGFKSPPKEHYDPSAAREYLRALGWDFVAGDEGEITWHVQSNITANSQLKVHEVEWRADKELDSGVEDGSGDGRGFLERLKPGDVIGLWALARYPGWVHRVEEASIEVTYDV